MSDKYDSALATALGAFAFYGATHILIALGLWAKEDAILFWICYALAYNIAHRIAKAD